VTVLLWIYGPFTWNGEPLTATLYEMIPGFLASTIAAVVVSLIAASPRRKIVEKYDEMVDVVDGATAPGE
jgi:SSS family solute:Na+ symporter